MVLCELSGYDYLYFMVKFYLYNFLLTILLFYAELLEEIEWECIIYMIY